MKGGGGQVVSDPRREVNLSQLLDPLASDSPLHKNLNTADASKLAGRAARFFLLASEIASCTARSTGRFQELAAESLLLRLVRGGGPGYTLIVIDGIRQPYAGKPSPSPGAGRVPRGAASRAARARPAGLRR